MTTKAQATDKATQQVAELFEQYHRPIFAYLYRLVDDWEIAHDLTQETFLQVLRAANRLDTVENPRAWTYRIATNLAMNILKRRGRFSWLSWWQADMQQLATEDPAPQIHKETDVARALTALPARYRAPLLLYSHDGFTVREVAAALNLSEAAVKVRLHRARELFRQAYEKEAEK